jgi:tungstate transport system ATP-binding protein
MRGNLSILPLDVRDLGFSAQGTPLLQGVSFRLNGGGPTAVLGPNGAGKSLLLRLCHGLLTPTTGAVSWSGPDQHRHAMVLQRPVLLRRSARGNIVHALALRGIARAERAARADAALDKFGLLHLAERPARVLSGGEQQRLAIARAWSAQPQVLFLDEPSSALDPGATRTIEEMLQVVAAEGVKIVLATHDLGQARRLADDVLFFNRGRLVEHAPAAPFFAAPATPEAQAFVRGELLW